MKTIILMAALMIMVLSGCAQHPPYPLPVDEKNIKSRLKEQNGEYGLSLKNSKTEAIKDLQTYSEFYFLKSSEIRKDGYISSDVGLGFGIGGLVAGAAGSAVGAAAGAALAAASGIPASRYHYAVQAANYELASDAMYCMYRVLSPIEQNEPEHLPSLTFINDKTYEVRRNLRKVQGKVTLASPDMEALEAALGEVFVKKKAAEDAEEETEEAEEKLAQEKADLAVENAKKAGLKDSALRKQQNVISVQQARVNAATNELKEKKDDEAVVKIKLNEEKLNKCTEGFGS